MLNHIDGPGRELYGITPVSVMEWFIHPWNGELESNNKVSLLLPVIFWLFINLFPESFMTTGYLPVDILKVVLFEFKIFMNKKLWQKDLTFWKSDFTQGGCQIFYSKENSLFKKWSRLCFKKWLQLVQLRKKSQTMLFTVSFDCDLDPL